LLTVVDYIVALDTGVAGVVGVAGVDCNYNHLAEQVKKFVSSSVPVELRDQRTAALGSVELAPA
jgi:hypothetical protein